MSFLVRFWRKVFFSEMNPIIALGAQRSLEAADFPALPKDLEPTSVCLDEKKIDWSNGAKLLRTLILTARPYWIFPLMLYLTYAFLNLSGPVFVNLFVKRLQAGVTDTPALTEALIYGLAIGFSGIFAGLCIQHYFLGHLKIIQLFVNLVNTKIYRHSLRLSKTARERIPVGDIVNHMSTDTDSVAEVSNALCDLIYCTVVIIGAVSLLFYYIGSTAWVALALLSILGPVTRKVSRDFTRFDEDLMKHRDRRVSLMSQLLTAIRLVKYFVWEKSVGDEVQKIRSDELASRRRIARAELVVTLIYVSVGTLVLFAVLAVYTLRGGVMDPALIFTCVSLFGLLEDPFAFISKVISQFISAKVGAERITQFLAQPTTDVSTGDDNTNLKSFGFEMNNLSVHLGEARHPSLLDVSLKLAPGKSLAVVGPVGSGKSTFINALLGEVERSSGDFKFVAADGEQRDKCRIGYVPQEAYILNGTMRDNVTFGRADIPEREVQRALELAGLWQDVCALSGGLNAEIGEKGVNLSGGQRQRLSLARAVMHRPQIVILDDPLSAVDSNTEAYLAHHLLFGEWKNVTKVVITHRLSHLAEFDQIVFLEAGRVKGIGTFDELMLTCAEFRSYLDEYGRTQTSSNSVAEAHTDLAPAVSNGDSSRITEDEDRAFGAVHGGVYWDYIKSLGGENKRARPFILFMLFAAAASGTVFPLLQKSWLATVSNIQSGQAAWISGTFLEPLAKVPITSIYIYGGLGLLVMAATLWADLYWLRRGLLAGKNIHNKMLDSILGAGTRFFDSTPVGRVLQRFSRDMEAIDIQLQWSFEHSMKCLAQVLVTLVLILASLPLLGLFIAPIMVVYYRVQKLYRMSAREAKRLDSISRSPRYAHFKETLQGLTVIRAYGKSEWFLEQFFNRLSFHQRMFYGHYMVNRWFSTRIPVLGGMVSLFTAAGIVLAVRSEAISPGLAGLLTIYSLSFWGVLNWGIRIWAEVEARMTSMERVKFYSRLPQERSVVKPEAKDVVWPLNGEVRFEDVIARYAEHLPQVLKGLSFHVPAGTKVGIIGRTGSGKSTLFQTLFRFIELDAGRILIDGVDIASLPLAKLRKALAIIPQDPTLFMGTLRTNLDRYNEFSDVELWAVLNRTCLGDMVRALPKGLLTELSENGANFSQGQRQLLCLARALLLKAKVIILDEATASVDVKTDAQVQKIVRESCQGVTMLVIAHRLGTVRDCDQIIEISDGRLRRVIQPVKQEPLQSERQHSYMIEAGK